MLVLGAGAIGGWLGGRLRCAGVQVQFVGRPRVLEAWRHQGLTLSDLAGWQHHLAPAELDLHDGLTTITPPALVLLCVKSAATAGAATELAAALPPGTPVLSMQNGVNNLAVGQAAAPGLLWLAGMVPYNVAEPAPAHLHRATTGRLAAQDHPALRAWKPGFAAAGLPLQWHTDMRPVQWGKLLLNLNNPVNALCGLPLREELLQPACRRCLALLMDEALAALKAAGIAPMKMSPLPPAAVPMLLRLPTPLFRVLAARMLRIDAQARSSMAMDLQRGRPTEVDELCGAVVRLARAQGLAAPANERMLALVKAWPQQPRAWGGPALLQALRGC
ncbi:2-dehydropantoate 2-reductase [Burkholderiales bacterium JOSHI_001]|nr:2-dehydropantoate 2-reductase [Burkholderiales bacterium JOSHI_001]